ncbi:DoxX family protein [Streptomyces sp. TRM66268-LWL]|uniref:DoxX family protein n=1 Tax=Streptomyces polyasparticus TaxID=2767826 RepID=A0ABR7SI12_9ACTN|nr:DoxX family protein [Streptomyces polyasparticus]MBC9713993.1 DoxX family protein [Streptomyces polyasparticus]
MFAAYVAVTSLTAALNTAGAYADFIGHESVGQIADRLGVPRSWMARLGALMGAGALGLLAGFAVPVLGTAAAAGLILYFLGAIAAHLRVGDHDLAGALTMLALASASLALGLAHRGAW